VGIVGLESLEYAPMGIDNLTKDFDCPLRDAEN
jgi:hypothetical protein